MAINPHPLSLTSLKLTLYHNKKLIGKATGFIIAEKNQFYLATMYLATNWHVLTGTNPQTNELSAIPTRIIISHPIITATDIQQVENDIDLYDENKRGKWLEHPKGKDIDVVLLPIKPINHRFFPLDLALADTNILVRPAEVISVIGFPGGQTGGCHLPIWVTGFVASEPDIDVAGNPTFYANVAGHSGLSGAPVILKTKDIYQDQSHGMHISGKEVIKFLGIYSGRLKSTLKEMDNRPPEMQIGNIWKPIVLRDILSHQIRTEKISPI